MTVVASVAAWCLLRLLLVMEGCAVLVLAKLCFDAPGWGAGWFRRIESSLGRFARRRLLAVVSIGVLGLVTRVALLPVEPIPSPFIHDEFSYLLAGDTFASGRLANPTHPLWEHFETMHVDAHPTYASMYPPAQGLILASGKRLVGHPFAGVCLSVALMCAAVCWMLQGWLPPGWALLGGVLVVMRLGSFSYWANSYWGGALAATGGALVLGALPRLMRQAPRTGASLALACGIGLLLNTRPYEGAVLCGAVGAILLVWVLRNQAAKGMLLRRIALPAVPVLLVLAAAMAYYNWRVFGSPTTLPYQINRATYATAQVFVWQNPAPVPTYNHRAMRDLFVGWELPLFLSARTPGGYLRLTLWKIERSWRFFVGPVLTLPLLFAFPAVRKRRLRVLLIAAAAVVCAMAAEAWYVPHYVAPLTGALWVVLLEGMRRMRRWRWHGQPVGVALVRAVPVVCLLMLGVRIACASAHPFWLDWPFTWASATRNSLHRDEVIAELGRRSGQHLVIVRYAAGHDPTLEYVFNAADIDRAPIVWAREMDAARNRRLVEYFKDRSVWLLEPDATPRRLSPYPATR
jgi:hypothetical protein